MEKILAAFHAFGERLSLNEPFPVQNFVRVMEPVFAAEGYRAPCEAGERTQLLVIMDAGVGDFICFSGALREIRRLYPQAAITLVIFPPGFKLAEECPYIDFLIGNKHLPVLRHVSELFPAHAEYAAEHLLAQRFDLALVFGHYASAYLLAYMTGAKERIGHAGDFAEGGLSREDCAALLTRPLAEPSRPLHMADLCFDVLDQLLALPVADRSLELWLREADVAGVREKLAHLGAPLVGRRLFAIGLGGSTRRKHWPPAAYAAFLQLLLQEEPGAFFLLAGGRDDAEEAAAVERVLGAKYALALAGRLDFRETAAAVSLCAAYIGNDTSLLHMAAVIGLPVLEICCYGADLPLDERAIPMQHYPYRTASVIVQPARALAECAEEPRDAYGCKRMWEAHCIASIEPQTVLEAYRILLRQAAAGKKSPLFVCEEVRQDGAGYEEEPPVL